MWFEIHPVKLLKSFKMVHTIRIRGVTHDEIWGNMERVQVLKDEREEVELENGKKEEREGL